MDKRIRQNLHQALLTPGGVLKLTLKKEWFDLMVTGEKTNEFRKPSDWIKSRLFTKEGKFRFYDYVQFKNGYGPDAPMFVAEFEGFGQTGSPLRYQYSNGAAFEVEPGDYIIKLGQVVWTQNLDSN